jgi:hypothetical protein
MNEKQYAFGELKTYSRTVEVVESADVIGAGSEADPRRTMLRYWAKDGSRMIAVIDPYKEYQEMEKQKAAQAAAAQPPAPEAPAA